MCVFLIWESCMYLYPQQRDMVIFVRGWYMLLKSINVLGPQVYRTCLDDLGENLEAGGDGEMPSRIS